MVIARPVPEMGHSSTRELQEEGGCTMLLAHRQRWHVSCFTIEEYMSVDNSAHKSTFDSTYLIEQMTNMKRKEPHNLQAGGDECVAGTRVMGSVCEQGSCRGPQRQRCGYDDC